MISLDSSYSLRQANISDAEECARHRALMFLDMGLVTQEESQKLQATSVLWFEDLIAKGEYVGWIIQLHEGTVVCSGGIHLREIGPMPQAYHIGKAGHIANVYTVPQHRRRGLARFLVQTMLDWCKLNRLDQVTLTASKYGKSLYDSLGFVPSNDMKKI